MKNPSRLLLALLAVAGSSAVLAQSSVTLYGRVNTTVERQKTGDNTVTRMVNNSSRFGFRGVEDLGGGLKAGFVLESGFNSDDGTGSGWTHPTSGMSFARQSEINLAGNFGMVRLGNFTPESYYATADYVGLHNHDTGSSSDAFYYDPVWFGGLSTKNKVGYRTPSMGGLTLDASVSMHEKDPTVGPRKNGVDLAANYNMGALALGAGYSQVGDNNQFALRGFYTLGQFLLGGYYQRNDEDALGSRNNFRLAGAYMMGASEFHLNAGRANSWSKVNDSAANQYTIAYNYNLSKRTKVYAFYTKVDNNRNAVYYSGTPGVDFSSFAVGVRHNF